MAASAQAEPNDGNSSEGIYFYPGAYLSPAPSRLGAKTDYGAQMTLGLQLSPHFGAEALTENRRWQIGGSGNEISERGASLQGVYKLFPDYSLTPFVTGGGGWVHSSNGLQHASVPLARGGAGISWSPLDLPLSLRGDASFRHEFGDSVMPKTVGKNPNDWTYSLGLSYLLNFSQLRTAMSDTPTPEPAVYQVPATPSPSINAVQHCTMNFLTNSCEGPPDADGDGVPDSEDLCPDTPRGAVVDADGCLLYLKSTKGI